MLACAVASVRQSRYRFSTTRLLVGVGPAFWHFSQPFSSRFEQSMVDNVEPLAKKARQNDQYVHNRENFLAAYQVLAKELVQDELLKGQPPEASEYFNEILEYNVPGGKLNRGMAVYDVLTAIKGTEAPLADDKTFKANALGWCIEWLQAFFLVADDIMDGSITRRGQPCWYKLPKVGLVACNDYILIECCIYRILKTHFRNHSSYVQLLDLFHEVTYQTSHGQMLDLTTAPPGSVDLSRYTLSTYMRIVTYKTAYYSFYLPVACGMVLAGITDPKAFEVAQQVCVEMGQYFQIQDDYLDCYGNPETIGKIGTDIEDNKCSWLICTALQKASEEQRELIKANYGKKDPDAVAAIKGLYRDLQLEAHFLAYEESSHAALSAAIKAQELLPQAVFTSLLSKIYKRQK